jgi:hypothetical protein
MVEIHAVICGHFASDGVVNFYKPEANQYQ